MFFDASIFLWLLLPVAAVSGWFAAKLDQRRRDKRDLPTAYFKGLNFLLNEQPDKAIEVFVQVLEVNSDTVETHLAVGNLFRRRGEVDRAIRVHQNLIARPMLDKNQRAQALLELGQDYLKAGLFDRAENLFSELVEMRLHQEPALRFLMQIYQQEREWQKAIAAGRKLARVSGKNLNDTIAQFNCELADGARLAGDIASAREYAKSALSADSGCVRASLLLGDIDAAQGRHQEAIKAWQRIEQQDPQFIDEAAPRLAASFRALGADAAFRELFERFLERHGGAAVMLALAEIVQQREGAAAAEQFIAKWLRKRPSVQGLHRLIELNLARSEDGARSDLETLKTIIEQLRQRQSLYGCQQCGLKSHALYWQCPGCNRWNSIKPLGDKLAA